jgi:hypothetical protein
MLVKLNAAKVKVFTGRKIVFLPVNLPIVVQLSID